jgi:hypothetical protein
VSAFTAQRSYSSRRDGRQFGPWAAGETVDLDPEDAAWVERDSPGCLRAVPPAAAETRQKPPLPDRQARGGANRAK